MKIEESEYGLKDEIRSSDFEPFMEKKSDKIMEDGKWNHINSRGESKEIKRYARTPIKVDALKELKVNQLFFLSVLRHNEDSRGCWVDMRQETICELYNINERTLRRAVKKLKEERFIEVDYYTKNDRQFARYKILDKSLIACDNKKYALPSSATFMLRTSLTTEEKGFFLAIYEHMYQRIDEDGNEEFRVGYSNGKIAKLTGMHKSTIAKYSYILQEKGFMESLGEGKGYIIKYNELQEMSREEIEFQFNKMKEMIKDRDNELKI